MRFFLLLILLCIIRSARSDAQSIYPRDPSIGKSGVKWINLKDTLSVIEEENDFDVDSKGNIYAIGRRSTSDSEYFVTKLNTAGFMDTTFNERGFREIGFAAWPYGTNNNGYNDAHCSQFIRINATENRLWIINGLLGPQSRLRTMRLFTNGNNDSSYKHNGYDNRQIATLPFVVRDMVMTPDDGFILFGEWSYLTNYTLRGVKFNADGELDLNFNNGVPFSIPSSSELFYQRALLLPDRSILLSATFSNSSFDSVLVCKITAAGVVDSSFGKNGLFKTWIFGAGPTSPPTVKTTILPDGSISVLSFDGHDGEIDHFRLSATGVVDSSFGIKGRQNYDHRSQGIASFIFNRVKDPYDLSVWGFHSSITNLITMKIVRFHLLPGGMLDTARASIRTSNFPPDSTNNVTAIDTPGGDLSNSQVLSGKFYTNYFNYLDPSARGSFGIWRINESVAADSAWGANGYGRVNMYESRDATSGLTALSDGSFAAITSETDYRKSKYNVYLTRIRSNGTFETAFGNGGFVLLEDSLYVQQLLVDKNDRIILVKHSKNTGGYLDRTYLYRYLADGRPDKSFGQMGMIVAYFPSLQIPLTGIVKATIEPDNKIVLLYQGFNPASKRDTDIGILRLAEDGNVDLNFGKGGVTPIDFYMDFINPNPILSNYDIPKNITALKDSSIAILGSYTDASSSWLVRLDKSGNIIRTGGENGRFIFTGNYEINVPYMEQAPTGDIIAISSNLQKGFYVTAYKPDLTESVRKYGNTNTIATQRLKGIAPLRNGKVIVNLVNRNDATNAWYPLTMLFKPSGGLDSAYGTNGIDFRKDIFPDTATRFSEFSTIETAEDREGQVMTAAVSEKNYMQDIVLFRELYNDEAIDSLPSPPVIRANAVCDGSAVTLLANSPGCSTCLYTWSNGQTGKNISVSDAGTFTVTAANASGSATSSYTVTMSVKPQITINNPTGPVCAGKEVTLTANGADRYTWSGPDIVYVNGNVMKILPLVSGEYEVLAEKNGCAVADTFFLQVKAAVTPTVDIQYSGCPSDSLRFTAALTNTGNNPVVTWYRNDSIAGTGQVIRLTGLNNNDVIRCIVMPDVFCTSIDTVSTTLVLNCIKEVAGGNGSIGSVSVTPNPAANAVTIKIRMNEQAVVSIAIYDLSGNRILSDYEQLAAGDRTVSFNTSNFQAGVYILRVSAPDETITQKIVIVK